VTTPVTGGLDQPLVWIDLEMTGLEPDTDLILEVAAIITDGDLGTVIEGPELVLAAPREALDAMDDVVVEMHTKSGLLDAVAGADLTVDEAEQLVLDWLLPILPEPGIAPLAGNSVHADRAFLKRHMPRVHAHLHYRNVDVSTLKELGLRWYPAALQGAPGKAGAHRALADIRESIAEMRHYREHLFVPEARLTPPT
jgi:oligoribonuclease